MYLSTNKSTIQTHGLERRSNVIMCQKGEQLLQGMEGRVSMATGWCVAEDSWEKQVDHNCGPFTSLLNHWIKCDEEVEGGPAGYQQVVQLRHCLEFQSWGNKKIKTAPKLLLSLKKLSGFSGRRLKFNNFPPTKSLRPCWFIRISKFWFSHMEYEGASHDEQTGHEP